MGYEPIKDSTKEQYLKIWVNFSVGHLTQEQLAELFEVSLNTVANAIEWVAAHRTQFDNYILTESAKEAVETRIRELKNDLVRIKDVKEGAGVNWNAVIGLNKIIKENEELLWKLQAVIQDKSLVTVNATQINQVIKARNETIDNLDEGTRNELISRVREILGKQGDN